MNLIYPKIGVTLARLDEWRSGGFKGRSGGDDADAGTRRSSDTSTPTESVAVGSVMSKRDMDRYGADYEEACQLIEQIERAGRRLVEIVDEAQVVPVDSKTKKPILPEPEGCLPCSRITDPKTGKLHENGWRERYTRLQLPGAPPDAPKVPLCRWHTSFLDTWGVMPPEPIVLWRLSHADGERIPRDLLRGHIPEEYARVMRARASGKPRAFGLDRLAEDEAARAS